MFSQYMDLYREDSSGETAKVPKSKHLQSTIWEKETILETRGLKAVNVRRKELVSVFAGRKNNEVSNPAKIGSS